MYLTGFLQRWFKFFIVYFSWKKKICIFAHSRERYFWNVWLVFTYRQIYYRLQTGLFVSLYLENSIDNIKNINFNAKIEPSPETSSRTNSFESSTLLIVFIWKDSTSRNSRKTLFATFQETFHHQIFRKLSPHPLLWHNQKTNIDIETFAYHRCRTATDLKFPL